MRAGSLPRARPVHRMDAPKQLLHGTALVLKVNARAGMAESLGGFRRFLERRAALALLKYCVIPTQALDFSLIVAAWHLHEDDRSATSLPAQTCAASVQCARRRRRTVGA